MSGDAPAAKRIEELSFEEAVAELEAIVDRLDRGEIPLADSIDAYERGTRLRRHCEQKLNEARLRVERLVENADGAPHTEPLDPEAT